MLRSRRQREGGGRRPAFTGLATQPYSATEVDGWQHKLSRVSQNRAAVHPARRSRHGRTSNRRCRRPQRSRRESCHSTPRTSASSGYCKPEITSGGGVSHRALRKLGLTAQREIETAVREATANARTAAGCCRLPAAAVINSVAWDNRRRSTPARY